MTENPYAAPGAIVLDSQAVGAVRLYSPTQVACGTIGGPVGLIYFLRENFAALGNDAAAAKTVLYGALFILGIVLLLPFLPDKVPSAPFTIAYILIARGVAQKYQMTKQDIADSPHHDFHSNWRVLWIGLLCLIGSVAILMGGLFLMAFLGIWNP